MQRVGVRDGSEVVVGEDAGCRDPCGGGFATGRQASAQGAELDLGRLLSLVLPPSRGSRGLLGGSGVSLGPCRIWGRSLAVERHTGFSDAPSVGPFGLAWLCSRVSLVNWVQAHGRLHRSQRSSSDSQCVHGPACSGNSVIHRTWNDGREKECEVRLSALQFHFCIAGGNILLDIFLILFYFCAIKPKAGNRCEPHSGKDDAELLLHSMSRKSCHSHPTQHQNLKPRPFKPNNCLPACLPIHPPF